MAVWFAVVASAAFMYMTSPNYEFSTPMRMIFVVVYVAAFFGGMMYDDKRNNRIKKLENEIEKLKDR